jgi:ribosome-binding factor A
MPHTKRLEEGGGMQHFRDALARILVERVEFLPGSLVTLIDAKVTRDTKNAKGVISVYPLSTATEALRRLKDADHDIRQGLGEILRLRRIPRLHWELDTTEANAEDIERTLEELKKKGEL